VSLAGKSDIAIMNDQPTERLILLLEPDAQQAQQLAAGFRGESGTIAVVTIAQFEQAQDFLWRRGAFTQAIRPDLILLNFPPTDSQAMLQVIKNDRQFWQIPVILLNHSQDNHHIFASYLAQGNCYVLKSAQDGDLSAIAQQIEAFWLGIVTLPGRGN
jgi:two-component system, chemotaxis family, response regulator Rcp1